MQLHGSYLSYLLESTVRTGRTYIGATINDGPWVRLEQHNGVRDGGVARLQSGRPWRVVSDHDPIGPG